MYLTHTSFHPPRFFCLFVLIEITYLRDLKGGGGALLVLNIFEAKFSFVAITFPNKLF